jgi:hypothetical protein
MSFSLSASVRTCQVESGEANRIQSDRFLNPNNMVCIPWNGTDLTGRQVCPDSWYTKTPGCNSAEDRVMVENVQRPQYASYITLDAAGISGDIYGDVSAHNESLQRNKMLGGIYSSEPTYGEQLGANIRYNSCAHRAYERAMQEEAQSMREQASAQNGYEAYRQRRLAGF